jgi:hypothetical protein
MPSEKEELSNDRIVEKDKVEEEDSTATSTPVSNDDISPQHDTIKSESPVQQRRQLQHPDSGDSKLKKIIDDFFAQVETEAALRAQ